MITQENLDRYLSEEYRFKIAQKLKSLRMNFPYKVTQEDVANMLHVERQHINRLENGKVDIRMQELMFYSLQFNCSLEEILYGDQPEYQSGFGFNVYPDQEEDFE